MKSRTLGKAVLVGIALVVLTFGVAEAEIQRIITVKAEEGALNYSEALYWTEEQFDQEYKEFSVNKANYLGNFQSRFTADHIAPYSLKATGWAVSFISEYELKTNKVRQFSLYQCKVQGAWSGSWFRFEWLLRPIFGGAPDLYGFKYTPDKTGLVYKGEVDHVPTTITLIFPKPISHCHYHVWYRG